MADVLAWILPGPHLVSAIVTTLATAAALALVWRSGLVHRHVQILSGHGSCHYGDQPYYFLRSGSSAFNETPHAWRLRPLDAACEPRELVAPLLNASGDPEPSARPLVIMLFGDRRARIDIA